MGSALPFKDAGATWVMGLWMFLVVIWLVNRFYNGDGFVFDYGVLVGAAEDWRVTKG